MLDYLLELAPHEKMIATQSVRMGQPIPDRIQDAPQLIEGLQLYLQAFFELDSERSHAMGLTPIPWSSIASYARAFGFDESQTEDLFYHVRAMDAAHLKRLASKQPKG